MQDLIIAIDKQRYENDIRSILGLTVIGKTDIVKLIGLEQEAEFQRFKKTRLMPARSSQHWEGFVAPNEEHVPLWDSFFEQLDGREMSEAGHSELYRLISELGIVQVAALMKNTAYMGMFRIELMPLLPTVRAVWHTTTNSPA